MTWETPKTNWNTSDGIGYADMNRIESNILGVRNATVRKVQGFGYFMDNSVVGYDGIVKIQPGSCYSSDGLPIRQDTEFIKNLTTWALGSGNDKGGVASAVTVAAYTWYYIFAILNSSTGAIDFMIDDDPTGANIPAGTFDKKRFINSFKTAAAGADGSFDICESFAIGDRVYINPDSSFPTTRGVDISDTDDSYSLHTLLETPYGYATPARDVRADLNIIADTNVWAIGLISAYGGHYTVPSSFLNSGILTGEQVASYQYDNTASYLQGNSMIASIMIPANRTLNMAFMDTAASPECIVAVPGFYDERLI